MAGRNRPVHLGSGVAYGANSLFTSVSSGVTGVISQPLRGAKEGGFEGFFKGLGKGIVGVVTKPIIGIVDLATNMSDGLKNTTTAFDSALQRQRLPRFIPKEGVLTPYSSREALGLNWLKTLERGRYFSEIYIAHLELRLDDLATIVTERRVLLFHVKTLKTEWDCPFHDMQIVRAEHSSISLVLKDGRNLGANSKMIPCPSESSQNWLKLKIEAAFADYIYRSRSE